MYDNLVCFYSEAAKQLQETKTNLEDMKRIALLELEAKKDHEKVEAVNVSKAEEREFRDIALATLKQAHAVAVQRLEQSIAEIQCEISERDQAIESVQQKREQLFSELFQVQADYQDFIDRHPLFDPGQTDYLLPDLNANPNVINPFDEKKAKERKHNLTD